MGALANIRSWLSWHYWDADGGALLWEGICETADELSDLLRLALRARFPSLAVDRAALAEIAFNQNLEPPRSLPTPILRRYLADPFSKWEKGGTRGRLLDPAALFGELALLGFTTAEIVSWRDLANHGAPGAFGGDSACFYVRIPQPNDFTAAGSWDDGAAWDDGARYDLAGPITELFAAIRAVSKWKGPGSTCRYVEVELPDGRLVKVPMGEHWEIDSAGNLLADYYNTGY